jgi:hypothetical protein
MSNVINGKFVNFNVVGETKKEALDKAENLVLMGDATQAFKNWQKKVGASYTEKDVKEFMVDYLAKKGNKAGAGYYITKTAAVESTRVRPYKIENVKNEQGRRKTGRVYTLINAHTGEILSKITGTKKTAEDALKKLYKNGLKADVNCEIQYMITEGEKLAFRAKYVPSKSAQIGEYVVFGLEKL